MTHDPIEPPEPCEYLGDDECPPPWKHKKEETAEQLLARKADKLNLEHIVRRVLEKKISDFADEYITTRIKDEIDSMIETGWRATNQWGEERDRQSQVTLRGRLAARLTHTDRYGSRRHGDHTIDDAIDNAVKKALAEIIEAETKEFKKELKTWKKEKMTERLRAALDGSIF